MPTAFVEADWLYVLNFCRPNKFVVDPLGSLAGIDLDRAGPRSRARDCRNRCGQSPARFLRGERTAADRPTMTTEQFRLLAVLAHGMEGHFVPCQPAAPV